MVRHSGLQWMLCAFALAHLAGVYALRAFPVAIVFEVVLGVTAVGGLAWRVAQLRGGKHVATRTDVTLAILALQVAFALVQASGDRHSTLYPMVYILAAFFAVAPWPRHVSLWLVLVAVTQNVLRYLFAHALPDEWGVLIVQVGFIGVFAILYHLILAARLGASRAAETHAVTERIRAAEEAARSLRLAVTDRSPDPGGTEDDQARRFLLGAILEVERSVGSLLESAHLALSGHALALYWLSPDEATIFLRDGRCAAGLLAAGPLPSGDGILGSVLRHASPVRQVGKLPGVNWYQRSVSLRSVVAVPVIERAADGSGCVRGVLVADRLEPEPYEEKDILFLSEVASQISRAVEAERLVGELHRARDAQDRLQRAGDQLNLAVSVEEVTRTAVKLAQEMISSLDLVAVTRVEEGLVGRTHVVAAAEGERASQVYGLVYDDNDGLVANVVRDDAPLPAKPPALLDRVRLFDMKIGGVGSLRVLPLRAGGHVLGTLVASSRHRGVIENEERRRLEALAVLIAGALARAQALEEAAKLAHTDVLTGLVNRRQLDVLGELLFLEAAQTNKPLSAIVFDLDYFRRVNDGHGRAVGDAVLLRIAGLLRQEGHDGDVLARYGGEEFVVLLPGTDIEGASLFAERLRVNIEATSFSCPGGSLRLTASFGVATAPADGDSVTALFASADDALFVAKEGGRNRVIRARPVAERNPVAS
jgi:diguanylate cyclase (GGDEF)-like protein